MTLRKQPIPEGHLETLGAFSIPQVGERRVRLYTPATQDATRPRPVLILLDGQNAFGDDGSFLGGWHAHRAVDTLVPKRLCLAPYVLAVDHGNAERINELGPWPSLPHGGGLTVHLSNWLADVLMPTLRQRVPVREGSIGAVVGGSSMGGLAALWMHYARPDAFGGALAMSPSLWFARRRIFEDFRSRTTPIYSRVYLDCGVNEGRGRMHPIAKDFALTLAARGYHERQLHFRSDPRGTHSERAWKRRLPMALAFMFRHVD